MPPEEELKFKVVFEKDTNELKGLKTELDQVNVSAGTDSPEAAKKAGSAYKEWLKGAREDVHLLHSPIRLLHALMGTGTFIIVALTAAWELFRGKTQEVIKATEESRDRHLELLEVYKKAIEAGVKLTEVQEGYRQSLQNVTQEEGAKLRDALQKVNDELTIKKDALLETAKAQGMSTEKLNEAFEQEGAYDTQTQHLRQELRNLNASLAENAAKLEAVAKGSKDAKAAAELMTRQAEAQRQALNIELATRQAHANAMLTLEQTQASKSIESIILTSAQKTAIVDDLARKEKDNLKAELDAKILQINAEKATEFNNLEIHNAKIAQAEQAYQDKLKSIDSKASDDREKITKQALEKDVAAMKANVSAVTAAVLQRIRLTHDLSDAVRAGVGAEIEAITAGLGEFLMAEQIKAAAAAFEKGMTAGGLPVALAQAAAAVSWYTVLGATALTIGGGLAADAVSGNPSGGSAGSSAGPSGGGGGGGTPSLSSSSTGVSSVGGPGQGIINLTLLLDSQVLLRMVQEASFNGTLQLSAKAIQP